MMFTDSLHLPKKASNVLGALLNVCSNQK